MFKCYGYIAKVYFEDQMYRKHAGIISFFRKNKLSFNAEHSELLLLNVPLHCHNFSAMVFYYFKIGFRCTIFRWLCILYYLPMKNMFCEIVVRLFIHQFLCVGFCSGFFFVLDFWFCLSIFFFLL